jgi:hypothetical protein
VSAAPHHGRKSTAAPGNKAQIERNLSYADIERRKPTEVSCIFIAQGMLHQRLMPILSGEE